MGYNPHHIAHQQPHNTPSKITFHLLEKMVQLAQSIAPAHKMLGVPQCAALLLQARCAGLPTGLDMRGPSAKSSWQRAGLLKKVSTQSTVCGHQHSPDSFSQRNGRQTLC